jgi:PIN domain nuclease of toxin-antitoxin system
VILLDTHVLVWLTQGSSEMGAAARETANQALASDQLAVSGISFWEIAMLHRKQRLRIMQPLGAFRRDVLNLGVVEIAVTGEIGIEAVMLDDFHSDPADRIIVATASLTRSTLVTADQRILEWRGAMRSIDARV